MSTASARTSPRALARHSRPGSPPSPPASYLVSPTSHSARRPQDVGRCDSPPAVGRPRPGDDGGAHARARVLSEKTAGEEASLSEGTNTQPGPGQHLLNPCGVSRDLTFLPPHGDLTVGQGRAGAVRAVAPRSRTNPQRPVLAAQHAAAPDQGEGTDVAAHLRGTTNHAPSRRCSRGIPGTGHAADCRLRCMRWRSPWTALNTSG